VVRDRPLCRRRGNEPEVEDISEDEEEVPGREELQPEDDDGDVMASISNPQVKKSRYDESPDLRPYRHGNDPHATSISLADKAEALRQAVQAPPVIKGTGL
jgi:hypothetical protein